MEHNKRVLLISYFFAPQPTVGATRAVKFYQYLPEFGWEPHVLTIRPAAISTKLEMARVVRTNYISPWKWIEQRRARLSKPSDSSPTWNLKQASLKSKWRQRFYSLMRHLLPMSSVRMPDATFGWYPFAIKAGQAILKAQKFDVIWSSTGPPTNHLIAAKLHQQTGIPWVADFRDLWSLNYQETRVTPFQAIEARLERRVLSQANRITTISKGLAQVLSDSYVREIDVVYNGYDDKSRPQVNQRVEQQFTIRYTGSLYPEMGDFRPFLQTLVQAREVESSFLPRFQFIGPELAWFAELVQEYGLSDMIECLAPVSRKEALALQQSSTALLLFGWSKPDKPGWMPVKMFEYMRTGRPILEIGPKQSESAATIAKCQAGMTVEQPEEIQSVLLSWWNEYQQTGSVTWSTDMEQVTQYSRRAQTGRLAEIFNSMQNKTCQRIAD